VSRFLKKGRVLLDRAHALAIEERVPVAFIYSTEPPNQYTYAMCNITTLASIERLEHEFAQAMQKARSWIASQAKP